MNKKINIEEISKSHIHDAVNLFKLANIELAEVKVSPENQEQLKKVSRLIASSANHFEEVFDSLNLKYEEFYKKEKIDIKDLIELEIFDSFKADRLIIIDKVSQNNAFTDGNFALLSKALLNLIENALKVSKASITIILEEELHNWAVKIHTPDKAFNESLAKSLEKLKPLSYRHGLKSVAEILKYHDAKLSVSNFYNRENSVKVSFPKFNKKIKEQRNTKKINFLANLIKKFV